MEDEDTAMAQAIAHSQVEASSSSSAPVHDQPSFPEESVRRIVGSGFTREAALDALQQFNGDVERALISLAAKSLTF